MNTTLTKVLIAVMAIATGFITFSNFAVRRENAALKAELTLEKRKGHFVSKSKAFPLSAEHYSLVHMGSVDKSMEVFVVFQQKGGELMNKSDNINEIAGAFVNAQKVMRLCYQGRKQPVLQE